MVGSLKIGAGAWDMMSGCFVGLPGFCFSSRMRGIAALYSFLRYIAV